MDYYQGSSVFWYFSHFLGVSGSLRVILCLPLKTLSEPTHLGWASIIHFTAGASFDDNVQMPAVFFRPSSKRLHFVFHQSGVLKTCDSEELPEGSWNKIEFRQYEQDGQFYNKLLLNDNNFGGCEQVMVNNAPEKYENVKVKGHKVAMFILLKKMAGSVL